jgi:hypothetical protein
MDIVGILAGQHAGNHSLRTRRLLSWTAGGQDGGKEGRENCRAHDGWLRRRGPIDFPARVAGSNAPAA